VLHFAFHLQSSRRLFLLALDDRAERRGSMEVGDEDDSFSLITCGPGSLAPKLLVGVVDVKKPPHGPTTYVLRCSVVKTSLEWRVERRYSDFVEVRDDLHNFFAATRVFQCFGCRWFAQALRFFRFPRRRLLSSRSKRAVRQRKVELHQFACLLAAHTFSAVPKCTKCSERVFKTVRDFLSLGANVEHPSSAAAIAQALQPRRFAPISDPSKSKLEFRRRQGIWKVVQAEKPVFSKLRDHERYQQEQAESSDKVALSPPAAPREARSGASSLLMRNSSMESGAPTVADEEEESPAAPRIAAPPAPGQAKPAVPRPPPEQSCPVLEPFQRLPPSFLCPSLML
jgi:hypothetical protein